MLLWHQRKEKGIKRLTAHRAQSSAAQLQRHKLLV
jgi:hypothetical protein